MGHPLEKAEETLTHSANEAEQVARTSDISYAHLSVAGRYFRWLTVSTFLLLLGLPTLQSELNLFEITPLVENRLKNPKPTNVIDLLNPDGSYTQPFEKYYNDTFGLRDFLIRLKNQTDYSLFSSSREIVIGKEGWLFYQSVVKEQLRMLSTPTSDLQRVVARLIILKELLKQRGIHLILVPCPMKGTIYPEFLPDEIKLPKENSAFFRYISLIKESGQLDLIDVTPKLLELKTQFPVYHKTDFHWNDVAGAHILKDLIDKLGELSNTGVKWTHPVEYHLVSETRGGQNNSLGVFWPPAEEMLMLSSSPAAGVGDTTVSGRPNEWIYIANEKSPASLLPDTIMFGDSFADAFLRAGMTYPFKELRKFYNLSFKDDFSKIPKGTRFLIFEHVETVLPSMLSDDYWPREVLEREEASPSKVSNI